MDSPTKMKRFWFRLRDAQFSDTPFREEYIEAENRTEARRIILENYRRDKAPDDCPVCHIRIDWIEKETPNV